MRFDTEDKDMVIKKIGQVIDDFTNRFLKKRTELLQENRDIFMGSVKQAIIDNGKISDSAKNVVLDIPEPKIDMPDDIVKLGDILPNYLVKQFLTFHKRCCRIRNFTSQVLHCLSVVYHYFHTLRISIQIVANQWDEEYLEKLSYAVVSESFNKDYLLYLEEVADSVFF